MVELIEKKAPLQKLKSKYCPCAAGTSSGSLDIGYKRTYTQSSEVYINIIDVNRNSNKRGDRAC